LFHYQNSEHSNAGHTSSFLSAKVNFSLLLFYSFCCKEYKSKCNLIHKNAGWFPFCIHNQFSQNCYLYTSNTTVHILSRPPQPQHAFERHRSITQYIHCLLLHEFFLLLTRIEIYCSSGSFAELELAMAST
jgi:hypothetical protein